MRFLSNDPSLLARRRSLRKNQTDSERKLWQSLRNKQLNGFKFFRQYSIGFYILDFYCPQRLLAIELDGGQHMDQKQNDDKRTIYLNQNGIHVVRFWNNDVLQNIDAVVGTIEQLLKNKEE